MKEHRFCKAKVFHARNFPKKNSFFYNIYYLLLDVNKLSLQSNFKSRFLSFNKFNIFSFYTKDHCKSDINKNLKDTIQKTLKKEGIQSNKIMLLTHPRVLGYVFNPVSFWFCLNKNNELIAVLAEVNNTFKETHSYLIFNLNNAPINATQNHIAKKEFHVSPFFKREGEYRFKFDYNSQKITIFIDYLVNKKIILKTSLIADCHPMTDHNLIKAFFLIPFLTLKVIILIHYQALKIFFKGIKYIKKPELLPNKITKNSHE